MADREEDLSKKKDLRNGKESGRWNPARWSVARTVRAVKRARTVALDTAQNDARPEDWLIVNSRVLTDCDLALSKIRIAERFGEKRLKEVYPNG